MWILKSNWYRGFIWNYDLLGEGMIAKATRTQEVKRQGIGMPPTAEEKSMK